MSELPILVNLLRDVASNKREILKRIYRLDENFVCSSMDVAKLWNTAQCHDLSSLEFEQYSVAILSNTTQDFFLPYPYCGWICIWTRPKDCLAWV